MMTNEKWLRYGEITERDACGIGAVVAIGPTIMMKFACVATKPYGVKTVVSLNPIMIDGSGMCGCCRITVGGKVRFACVEGPEFDGYAVDFNEALRRQGMYRPQEQEADHKCKIGRS